MPSGRERVKDGADHRRRRAGGAGFARALDAERIGRRRHFGQFRDELGKILGARHGVVLETAGDELPVGIEHDQFHQRLADALGDAAVNLPLAEQ